MKYNFDEIIDRKNSNSTKWSIPGIDYGDDEILPMWIADMDFRVANEILEALKEPINHGVLGYNIKPDSSYDSIIKWIDDKYGWKVEKEWILFTPGIVPAISIAVREFSNENDEIIIQPPVYYPFYRVLKNNIRSVVENPLVRDGNRYRMNLKDMERKISANSKLAILCSPHNPVGRVWDREELEEYGNLCIRNNIVIISDEIHSDLIYKNKNHLPIASISNELAMNTITLMSPSKTFNIAGLFASVAIIPNDDIRKVYVDAMDAMEMINTTIFSMVGLEASYKYGGEWLSQVIDYIEDNADFAVDFVNKNIPEIVTYKPDGTFLLWLDFNKLGKTSEELNKLLIQEGKVLLNDGKSFGSGGEGFYRLNIGCPRGVLVDGLNRIAYAVRQCK